MQTYAAEVIFTAQLLKKQPLSLLFCTASSKVEPNLSIGQMAIGWKRYWQQLGGWCFKDPAKEIIHDFLAAKLQWQRRKKQTTQWEIIHEVKAYLLLKAKGIKMWDHISLSLYLPCTVKLCLLRLTLSSRRGRWPPRRGKVKRTSIPSQTTSSKGGFQGSVPDWDVPPATHRLDML